MKKVVYLIVIAFGLVGCVSPPDGDLNLAPTQHSDYLQPNFSQYVSETRQWIFENRVFRGDDKELEVVVNAPFELKPAEQNNKAILLIHGLSDSPYAFVDVADQLAKQGFLVRTVLLPGHGGKPADLMLPKVEHWIELVSHHTQMLQQEGNEVWIGGFSTGANLALIEAYKNPGIAGVLLFSPAIESRKTWDFLAPVAAHFIDWVDIDPEVSITRFDSLTMNAAALYYQTANKVRKLIAEKPFTRPVLLTLSEADSVVNVMATYQLFKARFTHHKNQMIWFGDRAFEEKAITNFSMQLPEQRISTASHMSVLYSPDNPLYGRNGTIRICNNGQEQFQEEACNNGAETWFSSYGYSEPGKIHARLTWNPYFDETMQLMHRVIN